MTEFAIFCMILLPVAYYSAVYLKKKEESNG